MIDDDMSRYLAGRVIESSGEVRDAKKGAGMAHPPPQKRYGYKDSRRLLTDSHAYPIERE